MPRLRKWLGYFLLGAGITGIGIFVTSYAMLTIWQDWQNWVFDHEVSGQTATVKQYLESKIELLRKPVPRRVPPPAVKPIHVASNSWIGRIAIPRLNVRAVVREGVSQSTLGIAAGHIPGTAFPGQAGNVGIAGHRDTLFRGLASIRDKDLIQVETLNGNFWYEVTSTEIVNPDNVGVLKPGEHPELTLVTCYPFYYVGPAPERFIVKARQVPSPAVPDRVEEVAAVATTKPAMEPAPKAAPDPAPNPPPNPKMSTGRNISFNVEKNHSRELAPGISLGITGTNVADGRVSGWMWLLADRRTIWLRNQAKQEPVVFYGYRDGKRRELRITKVTPSSVTGYLVLPGE